MSETPQEYLARIGSKGGKNSHRKLTKKQARDMVKARERKRAAGVETAESSGSMQRMDGQQAPDRECPGCNGDGMRKWKRAVQPGANMSCLTCGGTGRVQIDASLRPIVRMSEEAPRQ